VGAPAVRRCSGRVMNLSKALGSLDAIIASIGMSGGRASAAFRRRCQGPRACWAGDWQTRKSRLSKSSVPVASGPCYYGC
jgi:hypothetical protein